MGTGYLIDSNALIDFLGNNLPHEGMKFMSDVVDAIPKVSVITKIEVLGFDGSSEEEKVLTSFIEDSDVFTLVNDVVDLCIQIRKNHRIKLPDALIAATAIANDLILITRNISDFKGLQNLRITNPHQIKKKV